MTFNSTLPDINDDDTPAKEEDFVSSLVILITPFVVIPLIIVTYRLVKFSWKIYKASLQGNGTLNLQKGTCHQKKA